MGVCERSIDSEVHNYCSEFSLGHFFAMLASSVYNLLLLFS